MKKQINEVRRMQQLAGILKENQIPGSPDSVSLKVFLDNLGLDSRDPIFQPSVQAGDVEELLQMIEDTTGLDQFTKSDLIEAMQDAQFNQELIDQIIDENPLVKGLEIGMTKEGYMNTPYDSSEDVEPSSLDIEEFKDMVADMASDFPVVSMFNIEDIYNSFKRFNLNKEDGLDVEEWLEFITDHPDIVGRLLKKDL